MSSKSFEILTVDARKIKNASRSFYEIHIRNLVEPVSTGYSEWAEVEFTYYDQSTERFFVSMDDVWEDPEIGRFVLKNDLPRDVAEHRITRTWTTQNPCNFKVTSQSFRVVGGDDKHQKGWRSMDSLSVPLGVKKAVNTFFEKVAA